MVERKDHQHRNNIIDLVKVPIEEKHVQVYNRSAVIYKYLSYVKLINRIPFLQFPSSIH